MASTRISSSSDLCDRAPNLCDEILSQGGPAGFLPDGGGIELGASQAAWSHGDLVEVAAGVVRPGAGCVELEVALEALARLGGAADLDEHDAEVVMSIGELGGSGADSPQLGDR